jgi:exo-beta-1,3-glucanase (GH17 family)
MKGGIAAAALAAMASGANAINHRHAHELFKKSYEVQQCSQKCTTIYTTITGEATLVPPPPPKTTAEPVPTSTHIPKEPVPTPEPITYDEPGTYTIPATTLTLTKETTVCGAESTHVPSGTHTLGGVTTVVEHQTTVTCPVATVTTEDGVVTSTIITTEFVCPEAGTYTIAPITTTVTEDCDVDYPVPTEYPSGTYTAPEQVVTVTETGFVTTCPYTSQKPEPTTTKALPPPVKSEAPKEPIPEPEPPKYEPPKTPGGGKFDGSFGGEGDHYGITYTPYDGETGECKSAGTVEKDIAQIKKDGFQVVRIYSTDCDTLQSVGPACKKHGIELIIGVFVKETGCSADTPEVKEQIDAIAEWAQWDMVKLFVIGNEVLHKGFCTAQELKTLIKSVKSSCSGYNGPYTTAETLESWLDPSTSGALCSEIDFTGANVHPFFNNAILPSMAGTFVKGQLAILDKLCPGKEAVNLECGWPNNGDCNGQACAGKSEQAEALKSIREECGDRTVFFSFGNDAWKEPGEFNCEQFWDAGSYFDSL